MRGMMRYRKIWSLSLFAVLLTLAFIGCDLNDPDEPGNLVPMTVDEDTALPSIFVNGTQLHAEAFGDIHNPIIVFLHGGPGSDYRAFISQIGRENASRYPEERVYTGGGLSQLQDEYYCVFYDQRGAGLSPRFDKGEVDFDMYVEDLDAVIDYYLQEKKQQTDMEDSQVILMGWSYGGLLATGYINQHPERVKDVILYESAPLTKEVWDDFFENVSSPFAAIGDVWLDEHLLSLDHITPGDDHARADYHKLLGAGRAFPEFHENENWPVWRLGAFVGNENLDFMNADDYDITSNLSAFQGRMLFIYGGLTEALSDSGVDLQMSYYPQSEELVISGVGHDGPWEKPDEVAAAIRDFLDR
ncbi:alpha/beta fold hydrolase [Candidatus Poribacteria bacterium]